MTKKRYAVIDLGTNTFHVLIGEKESSGLFKELFRKRIFINLAEDGIHIIGKAPMERAMQALKTFKTILEDYEVKTVRALGTAALRTASNGPQFIQQVLDEIGISIQLIPGDREAQLIYKGVIQAVDFGPQTGLIMDIGGGSVEFIIADQSGIKWAQSFPVGVAVLFNNFHHNDPIFADDIKTLHSHLFQQLDPLLKQVRFYLPAVLIGASGTFDVLETMLCKEKISPIHGMINVDDFHPLFEQLIKTNLAERLAMSEIPDTRAEMIIVALILIDFILQQAPIKTISVSAYAMKEGMFSELIQEV